MTSVFWLVVGAAVISAVALTWAILYIINKYGDQ